MQGTVWDEGACEDGGETILSEEILIPAEDITVVPSEPIDDFPKEERANLQRRMDLLMKAQKSNEMKSTLWLLCREDILYWVNFFVMTYNPRKNPSTIPFITYEYEDKLILELVEAIKNQKDILVEKSRDMGVTWCVLLVFCWFWQFKGEGFDFLVGTVVIE